MTDVSQEMVDHAIKTLRWGNTHWSSPTAITTVSYSFYSNREQLLQQGYSTDSKEYLTFEAMDTNQQAGFKRVLELWQDVANITFVKREPGLGDINIGLAYDKDIGSENQGWGNPPASGAGGDVWLNTGMVASSNPANIINNPILSPQSFWLSLHELGHALGLRHSRWEPLAEHGNWNSLSEDEENQSFTVMSYVNTRLYIKPQTPMIYDIATIQSIYGARKTTRNDDSTYRFAPDKVTLQTIWDGGGIDTIDLSDHTIGAKLNLRSGVWSRIGRDFAGDAVTPVTFDNLIIPLNVTIENAIGGSGDDKIDGNEVANELIGGEGNDSLWGESGRDILVGGKGDDKLYGGEDDDLLIGGEAYSFQGGILNPITGTAAAGFTGFNIPAFSISGHDTLSTSDNNELYGGKGNDTLWGGSGNDLLDGGLDADAMAGGKGNDTYIVDNPGDTILELANQGTDTVESLITYTLGKNLENLTLKGEADINGTGNTQRNIILLLSRNA